MIYNVYYVGPVEGAIYQVNDVEKIEADTPSEAAAQMVSALPENVITYNKKIFAHVSEPSGPHHKNGIPVKVTTITMMINK